MPTLRFAPSPLGVTLRVGALTLVAMGAWAASCGGREGTGAAPNVILVTLDTTRADFFGCYGYSRPGSPPTTPSFDALGRDGVVFERALSSAAVTPVSHASILTGRHPYHHGLRVLSADGGFQLPDDVPTLASELKARGWHTAAVHSAFPVSRHFGFERGFDVFRDLDVGIEVGSKKGTRPSGGNGGSGGSDAARAAEPHSWDMAEGQRRSDETTRIVREVLADLPEPFFLWIHYWDPHDIKRLPPDDFLGSFGVGAEVGKGDTRRYAAEVAWVDRQFGELVGSLRDEGRYERTLFAVTADHGEGLGEHDWQAHRLLYEEQVHVPLILRLPAGPRGVRVPALVRTIDVAPTILAALGLALPGMDGLSLLGLARGEREEEPRVAYADQINGYDKNAAMVEKRPDADFLYMLSDGEWKLIYHPNHPEASELFHLARDPDESRNLWGEREDVRERLLVDLARRNPWVTRPFQATTPLDPATQQRAREQLEALGYAGGGEALDAPAEEHWRWTCPVHAAVRQASRGICPEPGCGRPLILTRR